MKYIIFTLLIVSLNLTENNLWDLFRKVQFEAKYVESEKSAFYFPSVVPGELQRLEGKKVRLVGYYLPIGISEEAIVLSRYPMASCFFCGEAGPETVAMVYLGGDTPALKMDDKVEIEGTLEINRGDIYQLSFILREAKLL